MGCGSELGIHPVELMGYGETMTERIKLIIPEV